MKEESKYKIVIVFNYLLTLFFIVGFVYYGIGHITKEEPSQSDWFIGVLEFVFAFILSYPYIRKMVIYIYNLFKA